MPDLRDHLNAARNRMEYVLSALHEAKQLSSREDLAKAYESADALDKMIWAVIGAGTGK